MLIPEPGAGGEAPKLNSLPVSGASDGVPSDNTEDEWSRGSGEDPDLEIESVRGPGGDDVTELDRKVQQATRLMQRNCNCANGKCSKLKVRKVGEGKYNIAGKNVFVRVSMVGGFGGWALIFVAVAERATHDGASWGRMGHFGPFLAAP